MPDVARDSDSEDVTRPLTWQLTRVEPRIPDFQAAELSSLRPSLRIALAILRVFELLPLARPAPAPRALRGHRRGRPSRCGGSLGPGVT